MFLLMNRIDILIISTMRMKSAHYVALFEVQGLSIECPIEMGVTFLLIFQLSERSCNEIVALTQYSYIHIIYKSIRFIRFL